MCSCLQFYFEKGERSVGGEYVRLSDFRGPDIQGPKVMEAVSNPKCGYRYSMRQEEYSLIPGSPIAYWIDKRMLDCFENGSRVDEFAYPKQGLATADNNRFLRLWFEVDMHKVGLSLPSREEALKSGLKWFPYNKGGGFKKWYGNNEYLVNWENEVLRFAILEMIKENKNQDHRIWSGFLSRVYRGVKLRVAAFL